MMQLTRNRPSNGPLESGLDRLFDQMTHGLGLTHYPPLATSEFDPTLDVSETPTEWRVKAELPGVAIEDVEITVTGNVLTIRGEKKAEAKTENENLRRVERRYGKFVRGLEFPTDLDSQKVEARARNGVLTVTLPKAEQSRPRTVSVKVE